MVIENMPELRNFDLNLLVAFDLLMQEQNVSRAADRMFVSQSAMSHILQRLRQQLDDPLLVKTPSGMKPTDRALALIDPVKAILCDVKHLISTREEFDPAKSLRRFVIAATDYMDLLMIPALVERIAQYAAGIDIHVKRTESPFPEKELENNDLDVVLGFETVLKPPGQMIVEKLFDDRMTCLVRKNYPEKQKRLPDARRICLDEAHADIAHGNAHRLDRRMVSQEGARAPHRSHRAALPVCAIHRRQDGYAALIARKNCQAIRRSGTAQNIACTDRSACL